jgi:hypothetical protein
MKTVVEIAKTKTFASVFADLKELTKVRLAVSVVFFRNCRLSFGCPSGTGLAHSAARLRRVLHGWGQQRL